MVTAALEGKRAIVTQQILAWKFDLTLHLTPLYIYIWILYKGVNMWAFHADSNSFESLKLMICCPFK